MSGRKNKFSKIKSHLKSTKIDEKIGYLNKEMKKMGVISEVIANSTSDLYSTTEIIPPVPESPAEYTDVPDPNAVRSAGFVQPSNGFDVNDPATWENAYNDFSWLYNSNDVAGETDRPVLDHIDVDWTGGVAGSGIMLAHVGWGQSLGYLSNDGVYQPLITAGSMSSSMIPPIKRGTYAGGDHYKGDIPDDKWAQMQSIYAKYEAMIAAGNVATQTIKVWYPWSYFFNGSWESQGVKRADHHLLINATVFKKAGDYMSKPHENEIPGRTVVLTQHSLDDPNYYPGNPNGFMDFLRNSLDVGQEAFDWLLDQLDDDEIAGGLPYTKDDDPFGADDSGDDWEDDSDIPGDFPFDFAGAGGSPGQEYTDPNTGKKFAPNSLPKGWKPGDPIPKLASFPKVYSDADTSLGAQDGDLISWGGGGKSAEEKALDKKFKAFTNTANYNTKNRGDKAAAMLQHGYGTEENFIKNYGITSTEWKNPANWLPDFKPNPDGPAWNKYKKKNEKYEPQGELIKEGWESPKYTYIDKNQQKRWFKEKDVAPVYPKKAPPKMMNGYHPDLLPKLGTEDTPIPQIKVKKKDLLRNHNLKKDEVKKFINLVNSMNDYIKRNPEHLAYARERYPKSDPRLAALNYKMDMQIAAADEYIEKHFPENKRLLNKVLKATKQSIKLTDPKTFKSKDGVFTTFNKLERARHFDNEYKPKERKVLKKRRSKSVSRFFYKPKKKTKYDILKDKMVVLDKEIKKTMPDM